MKKLLTVLLLLLDTFCVFSQEPTPKEKEVNEIIDSFLMEDSDIDEMIRSLSDFQFLYVFLLPQ